MLSHEEFVLCLDALPMLISLLLLNAVHPGTVLRGPDSEFIRLTRKEKKALRQRKKDVKREKKEAKKARKAAKKAGELEQISLDDDMRLELVHPSPRDVTESV